MDENMNGADLGPGEKNIVKWPVIDIQKCNNSKLYFFIIRIYDQLNRTMIIVFYIYMKGLVIC